MMTYQHHEKLDGSGYPVGIGGDEFILGRKFVPWQTCSKP